jgi:periplasmic protein TonB
MAIRAFLLCGDEKAVHAVTQILDELEVSFEHSSEPPFALKRLATQRFDLLIVDCDNAQNATQVFNSARASNLNKNSIAIAIVEGKAGVPNAFRLGASLVLTKPVSLEQTRNTLRTGMGMTRKDAQEVKPAAAAPVVPTSPPSLAPAPLAPVAAAPAPAPVPPIPVSIPTPTPLAAAPVIPQPLVPTAIPPVPVVKAPIAAAPVAPPSPVAPVNVPEVKPPAAVVPPIEKPTILPRPASVSPASAQEHKPALTDFTDPEPPPTVGVAAFAKAAAAAAGAATAETSKFDSVFSGSASSSVKDAKPEAETDLSDDSEVDEKPSPILRIEDPLAEDDALDPVKDHAVPSFGAMGKQPFAGLDKSEGNTDKTRLMIAVFVALIAATIYWGWTTQPTFRSMVLWEYGDIKARIATFRGQAPQVAAAPVTPPPAPVPATPAQPVPPATQPDGTATIDIALGSDPAANPPANPALPAPANATPATSPAPSVPQVNNVVAEKTPQKTATVQPAKQDKTANRVGPNPALVPAAASVPATTAAKNSASDLLEVPEDFADDQVVRRVRPVYPKQALAKKLHGSVVLQAIVSKQGKVDSLQLVSGDPVLAQAAADAVKQWRYKPYSHNGEPTDFQTRVTVDFKMP